MIITSLYAFGNNLYNVTGRLGCLIYLETSAFRLIPRNKDTCIETEKVVAEIKEIGLAIID